MLDKQDRSVAGGSDLLDGCYHEVGHFLFRVLREVGKAIQYIQAGILFDHLV